MAKRNTLEIVANVPEAVVALARKVAEVTGKGEAITRRVFADALKAAGVLAEDNATAEDIAEAASNPEAVEILSDADAIGDVFKGMTAGYRRELVALFDATAQEMAKAGEWDGWEPRKVRESEAAILASAKNILKVRVSEAKAMLVAYVVDSNPAVEAWLTGGCTLNAALAAVRAENKADKGDGSQDWRKMLKAALKMAQEQGELADAASIFAEMAEAVAEV